MNSELFSLRNKTAVVTGAAGLLGPYHCSALAGAGATVFACDINIDECKKLFIGSEFILPLELDVTSVSSIEKARDAILNKGYKIDILVNNAAINDKFEDPLSSVEDSMFENYSLNLWNKSLNVNITGTFLCSQIFGLNMVNARKGTIINIASTYGIVAPDQNLYSKEDGTQEFFKSASYPVTKAAVIALTKYLAAYWGNKGLRVNALSPGGVRNNQSDFFINNYSKRTPLGRMAEPEDYMGALVFLASDASSYVNGENLVIDGGFTIW